MQVEDVARVGLAARRTAQDQRHLAVGDGLFRQVVVNDQRIAARVAEIFADRGARERREILQCGRVGGRGGYDDRVVHGAFLPQGVDQRGYRRALLADGHIDAVNRFARVEVRFLVQDRVDRDRGFSGLAVADDQFALSAADRNHRVDRLESGLQRLVHRLAEDDAGGLAFERHFGRFAADQSESVERLAQRVDDAAEHSFAHLDRGDAARTFDGVALLDAVGGAQQHDADVVLLEVHHHGFDAVVELEQFVGLGVLQSVDAGHAVAHFEHGTHFVEPQVGIDPLELHPQYVRYFAWFDIFRHSRS